MFVSANHMKVINPAMSDLEYKSIVTNDEAVCPKGYKPVFLADCDEAFENGPITYFIPFFNPESESPAITRVSGTLAGIRRFKSVPHDYVVIIVESSDFPGINFSVRVRPDFWVYIPV